jgi:hypothetical protein
MSFAIRRVAAVAVVTRRRRTIGSARRLSGANLRIFDCALQPPAQASRKRASRPVFVESAHIRLAACWCLENTSVRFAQIRSFRLPKKTVVPADSSAVSQFRLFAPARADRQALCGGMYGVSGPTVDRRVKSGEIPPPEPGTEGAPLASGKIRELNAPKTGKRKESRWQAAQAGCGALAPAAG